MWLGATVVNQEEANRDIVKLLRTPAAVRFLSMEPLLGHVRLEDANTTRLFGLRLPLDRGARRLRAVGA